MGRDVKYGKVTTERGSIPATEPVIVFRAQDTLALDVLTFYASACIAAGVDSTHLSELDKAIERFVKWRTDHADRVKLPDTAAG